MKNILIIIVLLLFSCPLYTQLTTDTFYVKGIPSTFSVYADGQYLAHISENRDVFYHGHGYMHTLSSFRFGKSEIGLRAVAESWSYSDEYQSEINSYIWAKPYAKTIITPAKIIDTLYLLIGDLYRVTHGQGLMLDNYESQGLQTYFKNDLFSLGVTWIGLGWTLYDDLALLSLGFKNKFFLRGLLEINQAVKKNVNSRNMYYISADARQQIAKGLEIYTETAIDIKNNRRAGLAGLDYNYSHSLLSLNLKTEYRYYDNEFFYIHPAHMFYFVSLTTLDKSFNYFQNYQMRLGTQNVFAARIKARLNLPWDFFISTDLEVMQGTAKVFAYETTIGFDTKYLLDLRAGLMNKFYNEDLANSKYYELSLFAVYNQPDHLLFYTTDKPWFFMKAVFKL